MCKEGRYLGKQGIERRKEGRGWGKQVFREGSIGMEGRKMLREVGI
jgi:hypothetical protein